MPPVRRFPHKLSAPREHLQQVVNASTLVPRQPGLLHHRPLPQIASLPSPPKQPKPVFSGPLRYYTKQLRLHAWVTSLLDNHYHTLGYLRAGENLAES